MPDLAPQEILLLASGAILLGLGLLVFALRRRHPPALAFSAFAIGLGTVDILFPLFIGFDGTTWNGVLPIHTLAVAVLAASAFGLFFYFPRRLGRADVSIAAWAIASATLVRIVVLWIRLDQDPDYYTTSRDASAFAALTYRVLLTIFDFWINAALFLFPMRARNLGANESAAARSLGIIAVGFYLFINGGLRSTFDAGRGLAPWSLAVLDVVLLTVVTLLWVRATRGAHPRVARNVIVAALGIIIVLAAAWSVAHEYAQPLARILGVLTLAYAVLRGQIEGLDLKVRFAISKSTIAAIFIAVFFIASEAAQQFFGDRTGSTYFGIAIAGTLVFAMAPIQRVAERLAAKAVPVAAPTGTMVAPSSREAAYLDAVHLALRDRRLTRSEETKLHGLAEQLGIGAKRAHEILVQAESEAGVA